MVKLWDAWNFEHSLWTWIHKLSELTLLLSPKHCLAIERASSPGHLGLSTSSRMEWKWDYEVMRTLGIFFFKLVIFLLKWADFLPYKRRLSFITDHVNGLYNNTLSESWPSQPALLGFHSVVCNTGWCTQQECSIFCLPGRQRAGLSRPALQENSFIMQTQEPSCSIYFGDYLIIILVSLKVLERL